jgi:D-arabinose 1-dehydrogenase-like Zn-dependent alcohol dehydrogenase
VGGAGTLPRSLKALKMGGTIAQVGVLSAATPAEAVPVPLILHKQARIRGIYVGSRQDFVEMNKAISLGHLRPVGEDFPWTHAREVLGRMENGGHFGKLVMTVA